MARSRRSKIVPLKSLVSDPFILIGPPGTGLHDETVAACRAAGFIPRLGQPAPRITSTLSLVAAGLGIALVPSTMQSVRIAGIVYRRIQGAAPKAFLGLASREATRRRCLDNLSAWFERLPEQFAELIRRATWSKSRL